MEESRVRAALGAAMLAAACGWCQTEKYAKPVFLFTGDELFLGGELVYPKTANPSTQPIKVTLLGNNASKTGWLYAINPRTGQEVYLFTNKEPSKVVDVTYAFQPGDRVVFKFVDQEFAPWWPVAAAPKYTGPNLNPSDPYFSLASSANHVNPALRYGNRWVVVAKSKGFPGEMEFGFEDETYDGTPLPGMTTGLGWASDMDFDDIVYRVSGVVMAGAGRSVTRRSLIW